MRAGPRRTRRASIRIDVHAARRGAGADPARCRRLHAWQRLDTREALLPALVARESVVDDSVTELFDTPEGVAVRTGTDAADWARGRIAADRAHLNAGDVAPPRRGLGGAA